MAAVAIIDTRSERREVAGKDAAGHRRIAAGVPHPGPAASTAPATPALSAVGRAVGGKRAVDQHRPMFAPAVDPAALVRRRVIDERAVAGHGPGMIVDVETGAEARRVVVVKGAMGD